MTNIYPFDLNNATILRLEPLSGDNRVRVQVVQDINGEEQMVHSALYSKDFYEVPQKRKTIANEVEEKAVFSPAQTKEAFVDWCKDFASTDEGEDRKQVMRGPAVQRLLDETRDVKLYGGEETIVEVTLAHDGYTGTITFTASEWTGGAAGKLASGYYNEFFEKIKLTKEDFEDLTDEWDERKEIVTRESITGWDTVVSRVLSRLQKEVRRTVHEDKTAVKNDEFGAWFDDSSPDPVVWVRSEGVTECLEEVGKNASEVSQLSTEMKKRQAIPRGTKKVCGKRCWPIYADALDITEADVHTDADEGGVEV